MWSHHYTPVAGSVGLSAIVAALPLFALLYLLGVRRRPSWQAALAGLGTALLVALLVYGMPPLLAAGAIAYGAAFGLFPIGWIVFWALVLYRVTVETGCFDVIKNSVGSLTSDRRLQGLLIAFAFGAFIEGAAGFGTPVAVAAAMLTGLGFSPFYAAGICLLANTAPVAFGSLGIPLFTLQGTTGLPLLALSGAVGALCAPVSLFVPSYLLAVMSGWRGLMGVLPAALACGAAFASVQYLVSSRLGPHLTDILSSLSAIIVTVLILTFWKPSDKYQFPEAADVVPPVPQAFPVVVRAWMPYLLLILCVLLWTAGPVRPVLDSVTMQLAWPGLHAQVLRVPPTVVASQPYPALFKLDWLAASGTACMAAAVLSAAFLGVRPGAFLRILGSTLHQLRFSLLTIASVLGLAFLMNYAGLTATLGLAFAATGWLFPFFSALLGWLGVFLTGSDTSANALFGNLQVVTANQLGLDPVLMAAANSSGGVMGKMISLQSIAVAAAATGMPPEDESRLFRFTFRHSVFLASVLGVITMAYAYL